MSLPKTREASSHEAADPGARSSRQRLAGGMRGGTELPSPAGAGADGLQDRRSVARRGAQGLDPQRRVVGDLQRRRAERLRAATAQSQPVAGRGEGPSQRGTLAGASRIGWILPYLEHRSQRFANTGIQDIARKSLRSAGRSPRIPSRFRFCSTTSPTCSERSSAVCKPPTRRCNPPRPTFTT